ncbi:2,4-dihydroxyhept-2-ene-1,7-dioic acid aldolase [Thozetella sp. PMI_491]|nr:2,4-dihydroxyhept-2-ene-1,7-dioic acid aldolase [Thozetella sp. PMI_491]
MAALIQKAATLRAARNTESGVSFGAWQTLPGANFSRAIARAGFDWVLIDCEHGNISGMERGCYCLNWGVSPIVRIADNENWMVKRALDAGAHGILVPYLFGVADAQKLVQWREIPPMGKRGFGSPFSQGCFDATGNINGREYYENTNNTLLICIKIKTREALDCVEDIALVPGVDVLFVCPWDLGNNIGHPVRGSFDPELRQAISRIREAAHKAGKKSGIYCPNGDVAKQYAEEGFQMITCVIDMGAIPTSMVENLTRAKDTYSQCIQEEVKGAAYSSLKSK